LIGAFVAMRSKGLGGDGGVGGSSFSSCCEGDGGNGGAIGEVGYEVGLPGNIVKGPRGGEKPDRLGAWS